MSLALHRNAICRWCWRCSNRFACSPFPNPDIDILLRMQNQLALELWSTENAVHSQSRSSALFAVMPWSIECHAVETIMYPIERCYWVCERVCFAHNKREPFTWVRARVWYDWPREKRRIFKPSTFEWRTKQRDTNYGHKLCSQIKCFWWRAIENEKKKKHAENSYRSVREISQHFIASSLLSHKI